MTGRARAPHDAAADARRPVRRVWLFVAALAALAVAVHASAWGLPSAAGDASISWPLLVLLFIAAESANVRVRFRRRDYTHTLSEGPLVLGLALISPTGLILARLVAVAFVVGLRLRQPTHKLAYNLAKAWLETGLAVLAYRAVLSSAAVSDPQGWLALAAAVLVGTGSAFCTLILVFSVYQGRLRLRALGWAPVASLAVAAASTTIGLLALIMVVHKPAAVGLVAVVGGITFVAARAYSSWRERHEGLERLHALTADADTLPTYSAIRRVVLQAADLMCAEHAEVVVLDPHAPGFAIRMTMGPDDRISEEHDRADELRRPLPGRPAGVRGLAARLPSWLVWQRPADELTVALQSKHGIFGHVHVSGRPNLEELSSTDHYRIFETFANHASVALENSRLVERLREEIADRRHEASHDALTGLPNRELFHQRVTEAISQRSAGEWLAVLLVDLDHFKAVNDTLGHHVGDRLLARLAELMGSTLQPGELVARLGGDEFAVLLTDLASPRAAGAAAARLREALAQPVVLDGLHFEVAGSVGIAVCPDDGMDSSTLLRHADVAMYLAKNQRSGFEYYRQERDPNTPRRLRIVSELREAIEGGQLVLHYQPKAALDSGAIIGVEALVRWQHPEHGLISPDEFIPVAEQAGLIRSLTTYVLRAALTQWVEWAETGHELEIAVNLSPWSLLDGELVDELRDLLATHGAPARALRLEITESGMMTDPHRCAALLEAVSALGVGLSIDDFGTGYSSLSWLNRLPVDEIKIDRSFVQGIESDDGDLAIVRSTIDLGRSLGLTVIAEGVENPSTWERLRALRCDAAQGYLLSRPVAADMLLRWLETRLGDVPDPLGATPIRVP